MVSILEAIIFARTNSGISDLHLMAGRRKAFRINGIVERLDDNILLGEEIDAFLRVLIGEGEKSGQSNGFESLQMTGVLDTALYHPQAGPIRIHANRAEGGFRVSLRFLALKVPTIEEIGVEKTIADLSDHNSGLILVCGPTGSGKSTTLAAIMDRINKTTRRHICTVEDPIEYRFTEDKCIVTQTEIGRDIRSFYEAVRGFMRGDPDVIFVGELRDPETIAAALSAGETGHLVLGTIHATTAADVVARMVGAFSADRQEITKQQLGNTMKAIIGQRLVPAIRGGRRAVTEICLGTTAITANIKAGKVDAIKNTIETSSADGMRTLEQHLSLLVKNREITKETAMLYAPDATRLRF